MLLAQINYTLNQNLAELNLNSNQRYSESIKFIPKHLNCNWFLSNILDEYLILVQNIRKRFAFLSKPFEKHRSLNQIIWKVSDFDPKHWKSIDFFHKIFNRYSVLQLKCNLFWASTFRKDWVSTQNIQKVFDFDPKQS